MMNTFEVQGSVVKAHWEDFYFMKPRLHVAKGMLPYLVLALSVSHL